jgi:ABC-type phosphate transport system substrate-binding protein
MFRLRVLALAIGMLSCVSAAQAQDGYKIVVNPSNPVDSISKSQAARLFLTRSTWESGESAHPVDLAPSSPVRESFYREVLGVSVPAAMDQWKRIAAPGFAEAPPAVASDREVLAFVRLKRGAIGYVSAAANVQGVKVVAVAGK